MAGEWVPSGLLHLTPWYLNLIEHNFTVQFIHRLLGWILSMLIPGFWRFCKGFELTSQQEKAVDWLLWAILVQFGLGVLTLIMVVPVWLGALHQAGAVVLFMTAVYNRFLFINSDGS